MNTKTATIQIGNTDNKLTQIEWSDYVSKVRNLVLELAQQIHFSGGSANWKKWQNFAWIIEINDEDSLILKNELILIRNEFNQDSIAWTEGVTTFI